MARKLVIFGTGSLAEVAHFYFERDSDFEVVAFTATQDSITEPTFRGLPLLPFEGIQDVFSPADADLFVAVGYARMNEVRMTFFEAAKAKGYYCPTYLSSRATHWGDTAVGENCFILEDNTLQPFVTIGDNVVLWSGNHIGHHASIGSHTFLASHVVVSGKVRIGQRCFIGVNATIREDISIGDNCLIGPGSLILKNAADKEVYLAERTLKFPKDSSRFMH